MDRSEILSRIRSPKLRIERALIVTKAHKEHEGEPTIIKRANVFRALANEMPVSIDDWQLIVGNYSAEPFAISPNPESCWRPILENLDSFATRDGDKYIVSEEDKKTLREVLPWWEGKSIQDVTNKILPDEVRAIYEAGVCDSGYLTSGSGNFSANYSKIIEKGMVAIKNEIEQKLAALDLSNYENIDKSLFYKAALICCDGAMEFVERYAAHARALSQKETSFERKEELLCIAKVCERAIRYPAENFHEAVQTFWFLHVLVHFESAGGAGIVAGRLDQYLYPFYNKREDPQIRRLLKNLWINYNQILYFLPGRAAKNWAGHPVSEQPTIGGLTPHGEDASNELTEMILEVEKEVAMPQPDIALMYHDKINPRILEKACDSLLVSMKPKIFGFEAVRRQGLKRGIIDPIDLINQVDIGCVATGPQGKSWGNNGVGFFSLGKVVELTLTNGFDPRSEKQISIKTGDPREFNSYEDFIIAFKKQLEHLNKLTIIFVNVIEKVQAELNPQAFTSILIDDCIERGLPLWKGGACYNIPGVEAVGIANAADSIAAVKKLIFDEKKIDMNTLLNALHADFSGEYAEVQKLLKTKAPKYGNDEDYVDTIAQEIAKFFCEEHNKYKGPRGSYFPSLCSVSAHVGLGGFVSALPDGRNAWQPLADGMSPAQGVCKNGPTAIIKSLAKIDQSLTSNGNLLNMKFTAATLKNPETRQKFISLVKTYMKLGGFHIQFNVIDTQQLIEAQKDPSKYPELIVRVAAYVAQFGQLPKELQDDIIARSSVEF